MGSDQQGVTHGTDAGPDCLPVGSVGLDREACCNPWGHKELEMTVRLNWTELKQQDRKQVACHFLRESMVHLSYVC